eukprot:NODE_3425_length_1222_cov_108.072793_g3251_i0.p1 GENE.NODE_3425_length_1222_cov_108.072793_g3251_i0~~NODE_3425_length_1222_cov_108.072793_g3251_i0.p1  ORF type:complete len:365 (-),score=42.44 NODE_3425_length_1222_cov_108.072793_g3251_i0:63-1157(-)
MVASCIALLCMVLCVGYIQAEKSCFRDHLCMPPYECDSLNLKWNCWRSVGRCFAIKNKAKVLQRFDKATEGLVGQEENLRRVISMKLDQPDKQVNMHFAGDNGVGKTWLSRLISSAMFSKSSRLWPDAGQGYYAISFNHIPETASESALEEERKLILDQIHRALLHCPQAVILVDELQNMHWALAKALVPALKGEPIKGVPSKNAIFILTSDFGHEGHASGLTVEQIRKEVYSFSAHLYKDDLAMANQMIVLPFAAMDRQKFEATVVAKFQKLPCKSPQLRCVRWDTAAVKILADHAWNGVRAKNGREIDEVFDTYVTSQAAMDLSLPSQGRDVTLTVKGDLSSRKVIVPIEVTKEAKVPHSEL